MSITTIALIFGYMGGMICGILIVAFNLCRLRLHVWNQWALAKNGGGQTRRCRKCQLYEVRPFRDFTISPANGKEAPEL